jgi:uncharacterized membrane protein YdjX (TVP38/TMEM64 family)
MTRAALPRLLLGLAIAGAAVWLALNRDRLDPALIQGWISSLGLWAPLAYVALFAVGAILFVPGAIFGLAGGALFGPLWGTILSLAGATLGATAAFVAARYLAADWVRRKCGGRLEQLIAGVEAEGWRFVAFVRLVPLFPFNLLNYALGLTRIPLAHYLLASLVCMAPGSLAYTWLGHAGREALAGNDADIRYGLIALGLLATWPSCRGSAAACVAATHRNGSRPTILRTGSRTAAASPSSTCADPTSSRVRSGTSPMRGTCRSASSAID